MGLLDPDLLTALQSQTGVSAGWVIEVDVYLTPADAAAGIRTTRYYAEAEVAAWGRAHYDGLVLDAGQGKRAVPLLGGDLQVPSTDIRLVDRARFWANLVRGPVSREVPGSPVRIYLVSNALTSFTKAFLETSMVIFDWERSGDYEITLKLKPDTMLLDRAIPDLVLTEALCPFADPKVWGLTGPLLYGIYDSRPTTGKGMLPAYCIHRLEYRWLATIGRIEVTAVFLDDKPWTDYVVEYVEFGGYDVTMIVFPNGLGEDVEDPTDVAVAYDGSGYKDGNGVTITNTVSQQAHFCRNFGFGNPVGNTWRRGAWLPSSPMLNVVAGSGWLESHGYFFTRDLSGACYIDAGGQRSVGSCLNEWSTSMVVKPFLKNNGKLDVRMFNHARRRPSGGTVITEDQIKTFKPVDVNAMVRKVQVPYHYDPIANGYTKNVEISDPTVNKNKGMLPHQLAWGPVNEGDKILDESAPDAP